jgi:hypothetical protein
VAILALAAVSRGGRSITTQAKRARRTRPISTLRIDLEGQETAATLAHFSLWRGGNGANELADGGSWNKGSGGTGRFASILCCGILGAIAVAPSYTAHQPAGAATNLAASNPAGELDLVEVLDLLVAGFRHRVVDAGVRGFVSSLT